MRNKKDDSNNRQEWYRLDNAATLYTLVTTPDNTCLFRLEASLRNPVKVTILQLALDAILVRFPYYRVNLQPGLFWHFWSTNLAFPQIIADSTFPCEPMPVTRKGIFPFRVRAHGNRIALEIHHSITDGTGASVFFKALMAEYFHLQGTDERSLEGVPRPAEQPDDGEYEDAYKRYYRKAIPSPLQDSRVISLPFRRLSHQPYVRTRGIVPLADILAIARQEKVSLTEYLSAVLLSSLQDVFFSMPVKKQKRGANPIRILVPVNLRNIYPSRTMRNFTLYVNPEIDPRLGKYTFADILKQVHHYMKAAVVEKNINRQIRRNVRAELHPLVRVAPLFLKKFMLRTASKVLYTRSNNAVLTNIGVLEVPAGIEEEISDFQFFLPPGRGISITLAITSCRGFLFFNFGRVHREPDIEKFFFRHLSACGLKVSVQSVQEEKNADMRSMQS